MLNAQLKETNNKHNKLAQTKFEDWSQNTVIVTPDKCKVHLTTYFKTKLNSYFHLILSSFVPFVYLHSLNLLHILI